VSDSGNRIPQPEGDEQVAPFHKRDDLDIANDTDQQRRQKLESIKGAVQAGLFDSEEVLEEAVRRMIDRLRSDEDDDNGERSVTP